MALLVAVLSGHARADVYLDAIGGPGGGQPAHRAAGLNTAAVGAGSPARATKDDVCAADDGVAVGELLHTS